jgi:hypothetical protein
MMGGSVTVVGIRRDSQQFLLRVEEDPFGVAPWIRILVLDLSSVSIVASHDITTLVEAQKAYDLQGTPSAPNLTAIRSARWGALQPRLREQGFEIIPDYPALSAEGEGLERRFQVPGKGMTLGVVAGPYVADANIRYDLVARSDTGSRSVVHGLFVQSGNMDSDTLRRAYLVRDHEQALLVNQISCAGYLVAVLVDLTSLTAKVLRHSVN